MFKSAVMRLTAWYLLIIVAIGLFFSSFIYISSPREVRSGLPPGIVREGFGTPPSRPGNFEEYRERATNAIRSQMLGDLFEFNLLILVLGGGASYWLAQRTLRPIEDALDAQSRFTADASHELRTPLTAMRSEIEVALRDGKLTKQEAVDLLRSNLEEVAKLEGLSSGLLKLAQHNAAEPVLEAVALAPVIEAAVARHQKSAKSHDVTVHTELGEKLHVQGDRDALVELLSVLLDNAIKYSHPGGTVWLEAKPAVGTVRILVRDEGVGIKAMDLPHIFSRFYRADSSRSKSDINGYGLGLSIAKKIVTSMGGSIEAKSTPGKGTTFTVSLKSAKI
ncbi:MAG TPA: HAMP domain-containing sensor histidine kinase [Candidatus Saccharimonadales bacterium]|nr:HAMP domain-containing sensor histidine kinase [Candidatus Saccharimonadales bacterium]